MLVSKLQKYVYIVLAHVPWTHWALFGVLSMVLILFLLIRQKCSGYGAIALGISFFICLFILDTAVLIRYFGIMKHTTGYDLSLDFSRFFRKKGDGPAEIISNIIIFVPFGFFLSEYFSATKRYNTWRRIGFVALTAIGISLCIELLQFILKTGYFELMDLLMNSLGAVLGASVASLLRLLITKAR